MEITVPSTRVTESQKQTVPTTDRGARLLGLLILLIGLGGFLIWAALAPISSAAVAPGVVTVEGARKTVQHLDGGIVADILVREGDKVDADQLLVRLDDRETRAQLEMERGQLIALAAEEARLVAERDGLEQPEFPVRLFGGIGMDDPRLLMAQAGQKRVFEARREAREGEISVLEQRIEQLQERIAGVEAVLEANKRRAKLYQEEIDALTSLFDRQLGDKSRLREAERQQAELLGEQAERRSTIASTRVQIVETELEIAQIKRRFVSEVVEQLRKVETELSDREERLRALSARLERTEVRSPASGAVVDLQTHTIGGVLRPGDKVLDLIPTDEPLLIEARVSPTDIDQVFPGLEADIRFTAFNASTTPTLIGQVLTVSADRMTDQKTDQDYFLARVQVPPESLEQLEDKTLLPGMPATVMIKTGERTFFEYLIRPISDRISVAFRED
ncbi:MAG: HlyD family type I secretion periplasmic adaptor subunit [Lamprobacter sp.]|uniref:HlyD family type I secretion periplasmic adaptor subunit n=1 Tax=Lamprobacter sp. TaxID=3100796 RepID=UPI002B25CA3D|nr:HlyD family type I secretion periplasmic adaptor subunit [Lamprobacter sp.]MEA3639607.1 HlyD family type I secretion periplasmic adaptor subunit [Lamprobacter sp.]